MDYQTFRKIHSGAAVYVPKHFERNDVDSMTDPTQDCPVRNIQLNAAGIPINVRGNKMEFSNIPIDKMTAIDRRNMDKFDILGEQQALQSKINNVLKQGKKNEIEKNN